jgi:hypothetical protein
MLKRGIVVFIIIAVIALCFGNLAFAAVPPMPDLKLTVEKSPLTIFPPLIIYTAQLSFMPSVTSTQLVADFYHIVSSSTQLEYLGSAPFDKTGKAVFHKQILPGSYTAIAKTVIDGIVIWSNKVPYQVP